MTLVPPSCKKCGNGNELKLIKSTDSKSKNYNKQDYKCLKCGNEFSMRYPYSGLQKDGSYIIYWGIKKIAGKKIIHDASNLR